MPSFVEPQLCRLVDMPPSHGPWAHELKFDGYRMQLRVQSHKAQFMTRKGLDWSERFPEIVAEGRTLPDCIIDGEVCARTSQGIPAFSALQEALSQQRTGDLVYYVFDILHLDGRDIRSLSLVERKDFLKRLLEDSPRLRHFILSAHFEADGATMLKSACNMSFEGIVSKRTDAPYRSGRGDFWLKAKCRAGQEVVIGGWRGTDSNLRSLLVGLYQGPKFVYAGKVGTGFNAAISSEVLRRLVPLKSGVSPFASSGLIPRHSDANWVKPKVVAEIAFANFTSDGILRQASFKGLREDKSPREIRPEAPVSVEKEEAMAEKSRKPSKAADGKAVAGVVITHPDKVLWPAEKSSPPVAKIDLAKYYEKAAMRLLPHLEGRPVSIVRAPDGIAGQRFFQRHVLPGMAGKLPGIAVAGEKQEYLTVKRLEHLVALAQAAVLELHPWGAKKDDPETPERLIFDLDPAPGLDFAKVIAAAKEMRERLEDCGLKAFVKTTGGKGIHVVTPIKGTTKHPADWDSAKLFARVICEIMAKDSPNRYTTNMAKRQRGGKIFLDYLRNGRSATAVAAWSPRARPGAPIAMPIVWESLTSNLDPLKYRIASADKFLKAADPWKDLPKCAGSLEAAREKLTKKL